jgi:transcriptional regulator with XRE-family HTH domain
MSAAERIKDEGLTQTQAAEVLHVTQPRVSALLSGKINDFRLDSRVAMAHGLGMHVSINVAASRGRLQRPVPGARPIRPSSRSVGIFVHPTQSIHQFDLLNRLTLDGHQPRIGHQQRERAGPR